MNSNGYISEAMNAGRILAHGRITSLANGFSLKGKPFSLYVRPKYSTSNLDIKMSLKCAFDAEFEDAPLVINDWSPLSVVEIAAGQDSVLETNDLYWGCGEKPE